MNATDVGWMPFVVSWIANREYETERNMLTKLFQQYPPVLFEWMRKNCANSCAMRRSLCDSTASRCGICST